jgi:molecular chaperone GrpE
MFMSRKNKKKIQTEEKNMNNDDIITDKKEEIQNPEEKKAEDNIAEPSSENKPEPEIVKENFEDKYKELYDKYLRLSAEFDNYRKRTLKEKTDILKYGNEDILKNLLPVVDDLERGIKSINETQDVEATKAGLSLIYNKFNDFLTQNGLKEIEALGKDFNVDIHEAVTRIPAPDRAGKIVEVIKKGYTLNDKVIRFSQVVIGE